MLCVMLEACLSDRDRVPVLNLLVPWVSSHASREHRVGNKSRVAGSYHDSYSDFSCDLELSMDTSCSGNKPSHLLGDDRTTGHRVCLRATALPGLAAGPRCKGKQLFGAPIVFSLDVL